MPPSNHIINKQLFEFECLHSEHAFQVKNKFDQDVQHKLTRIIERACDRLSKGNEDIRIPLLEIDLGEISFTKMEDEVVLAFEKQFYQKLLQHSNNESKNLFAEQPYSSASIEIIKYYLLTGQLPWFAGKQGTTFINDLFEEVMVAKDDEFRNFIVSNLGNEKFIERLMAKYDASFIAHIITLLNIEGELLTYFETLIRNIIEEIKIKNEHGGDRSGAHDNIYLQQKDHENAIEKSQWLFLLTNEQSRHLHDVFIRGIAVEIILKAILVKHDISDNNKLFSVYKNILAEKFDVGSPFFETIVENRRPGENDLSVAREMTEKYRSEMKDLVEQGQINTGLLAGDTKFYISNAGLILLAGYLPSFFDQLDLLDDGDLNDKTKKITAVFLLHYLCTGSNEAPEYILPLNKILCGLALGEPLPSLVFLSDIEKKECDELLNEVIVNWQKVGSLSVEGLRESFLNRDAILQNESTGWKLIVERRGYDVLLDSMPWSFNHIKLSWMPELITTEW